MKTKLQELDSIGIFIESRIDFLRFKDCSLVWDSFPEMLDKYWKKAINNLNNYFPNITEDSEEIFPAIAEIDLVDGYPVSIRWNILSYVSERELEFLLPRTILNIDEFIKFSKSGQRDFEISKTGLIDLEEIKNKGVLFGSKYKKESKGYLSPVINKDSSVIKSKERLFWDLIEKRDILPTLVSFRESKLVNLNQITRIDNFNQVHLSDGSFIKAEDEEIDNLFNLYNFGTSSVSFDCISVGKLGTIIKLYKE